MASETVRGTGDYDEFLLATMYVHVAAGHRSTASTSMDCATHIENVDMTYWL